MTKEERYQYLDKLAVEAKTDASAKEEICRHFKKYIHRLSYGSYEDWSREDAAKSISIVFPMAPTRTGAGKMQSRIYGYAFWNAFCRLIRLKISISLSTS